MQCIPTDIPDVIRLQPTVHGDDRGYFMECYRRDLFAAHVGRVDFIQDNESRSGRGVLRGLHYQLPPYAQCKLVRAVVGRILDVAVDIRRGSATFGRHVALELSQDNKSQLFIPRGFAHGFVVLSQEAVVLYKVDAPYAPDHERGIRFDDPALGIDWRNDAARVLVSEKDRQLPSFSEAELFEY
jgi:dTDP-4-dehydrorhamnose 3,5-epimerase